MNPEKHGTIRVMFKNHAECDLTSLETCRLKVRVVTDM